MWRRCPLRRQGRETAASCLGHTLSSRSHCIASIRQINRCRAIMACEAKQSDPVNPARASAVMQALRELTSARRWAEATQLILTVEELLLSNTNGALPPVMESRKDFTRKLRRSYSFAFFSRRQLSESWKTALETFVASLSSSPNDAFVARSAVASRIEITQYYACTAAAHSVDTTREVTRMAALLSRFPELRLAIDAFSITQLNPPPFSIHQAVAVVGAALLSTLLVPETMSSRASGSPPYPITHLDDLSLFVKSAGALTRVLRDTENHHVRLVSEKRPQLRELERGVWGRTDHALACLLTFAAPAVDHFTRHRLPRLPSSIAQAVLDDLVGVFTFCCDEIAASPCHPYVHFPALIGFAEALCRAQAPLMIDAVVAPYVTQLVALADVTGTPPATASTPCLWKEPRALGILREVVKSQSPAETVQEAVFELIDICSPFLDPSETARSLAIRPSRRTQLAYQTGGGRKVDPFATWYASLAALKYLSRSGWDNVDVESYSRLLRRLDKAGRWKESVAVVSLVATSVLPGKYALLHPQGVPPMVAKALATHLHPASQLRALMLLDGAGTTTEHGIFPFIDALAWAGEAVDMRRAWDRVRTNQARALGAASSATQNFARPVPLEMASPSLLALQWCGQWQEALSLLSDLRHRGGVTETDYIIVSLALGLREQSVQLVVTLLAAVLCMSLSLAADASVNNKPIASLEYILVTAMKKVSTQLLQEALVTLVTALLSVQPAVEFLLKRQASGAMSHFDFSSLVSELQAAYCRGALDSPLSIDQVQQQHFIVTVMIPWPELVDVIVTLPVIFESLLRRAVPLQDVLMGVEPIGALRRWCCHRKPHRSPKPPLRRVRVI